MVSPKLRTLVQSFNKYQVESSLLVVLLQWLVSHINQEWNFVVGVLQLFLKSKNNCKRA